MERLLRKMLFSVSAVLLFFMVGSLFLQVLAREFRWSVDWTEESARFAFIAMVFIAAAYATLTNSHLRVTVFSNWVASKIGERIVNVVHSVILIAFGGVMTWFSLVNFQEGHRLQSELSFRVHDLRVHDDYLAASCPTDRLFQCQGG